MRDGTAACDILIDGALELNGTVQYADGVILADRAVYTVVAIENDCGEYEVRNADIESPPTDMLSTIEITFAEAIIENSAGVCADLYLMSPPELAMLAD